MVIGKILIFPLLTVIFLSVSYQEAYGAITSQLTIGDSGVPGSDQSHFNFLIGTAVDSSGNIYVADENNNRVKKFGSNGNYLFQIGCAGTNACVAGSGPDELSSPTGVAVDSGKIYVADEDNHRVQIFDSSGVYQKTIGVTGVPGSDQLHFKFPAGVAVDSSGNIYVADADNHRVQIFDSFGNWKKTIGVSSIPTSEYSGVAVDSLLGDIYVADSFNYRVQKFDSAGVNKLTIGVTGVPGSDQSHFNSPAGVAVDSLSGDIYVADSLNHRVQIFDSSGNWKKTIGETGVPGIEQFHFNFPTGVAVDSSGNIIVGDSFNYRVQIFSALSISNGDGADSLSDSSDDPLPSKIKPSFGGVGNMVFADGLTLDGKVYDLSKFAQEIPKTIADVGQPIKIKIKEQLAHGPTDWKYVAVYMNFEGKDPETYNAHLIMSIDKNEGQKLVDPKGYIKDYTVTTELDSKYVYTTFSFIAAKAMPDSTMIVAAWDGHSRINSVHVGGAIQFGQDPVVQPHPMPSWLHVYNNVRDANFAVENAGYVKPELFAHISNTQQVWSEPNTGHVLWFFDTVNGQVAILSYDTSGNMIWHKEQILEKAPVVTTTTYSGQHLDRNNEIQMQNAKSSEELRSLQTLERSNFHD